MHNLWLRQSKFNSKVSRHFNSHSLTLSSSLAHPRSNARRCSQGNDRIETCSRSINPVTTLNNTLDRASMLVEWYHNSSSRLSLFALILEPMLVQTRGKTSLTEVQQMLELESRTDQALELWPPLTKSSTRSRPNSFKNRHSINRKTIDNNLYNNLLSPCSNKSPCNTTRPLLSTAPINNFHRASHLATYYSQILSNLKLKVRSSQSNNIIMSSIA